MATPELYVCVDDALKQGVVYSVVEDYILFINTKDLILNAEYKKLYGIKCLEAKKLQKTRKIQEKCLSLQRNIEITPRNSAVAQQLEQV